MLINRRTNINQARKRKRKKKKEEKKKRRKKTTHTKLATFLSFASLTRTRKPNGRPVCAHFTQNCRNAMLAGLISNNEGVPVFASASAPNHMRKKRKTQNYKKKKKQKKDV